MLRRKDIGLMGASRFRLARLFGVTLKNASSPPSSPNEFVVFQVPTDPYICSRHYGDCD